MAFRIHTDPPNSDWFYFNQTIAGKTLLGPSLGAPWATGVWYAKGHTLTLDYYGQYNQKRNTRDDTHYKKP